MSRQPVAPRELRLRPFTVFDKRWFLLAAGDFASGDWNAMTVSWGGLGTLWNRPVATVLVRPTRHTFGFIERHPAFTVCSFPESFRPDLLHLGTVSGRDGDKFAATGLTPHPARLVSAPLFEQADLAIECRVLHAQDIDPSGLLEPSVRELYPRHDWHRVYVGEVLAVEADPEAAL